MTASNYGGNVGVRSKFSWLQFLHVFIGCLAQKGQLLGLIDSFLKVPAYLNHLPSRKVSAPPNHWGQGVQEQTWGTNLGRNS